MTPVYSQVKYQVWNQMRDGAEKQVESDLLGIAGWQVRNLVRQQIGIQVWSRIDSHIRKFL